MTHSTRKFSIILITSVTLAGCQKSEPPQVAAQWSENDHVLDATVARVDEFTSHVRLTHAVGKKSESLDLYLGDNERFVKKSAKNIQPFRSSVRAAFPLQVDKQPINDHSVLTDEDPTIWATRAAVFGGRYVGGSDESETPLTTYTACTRKCCFRTPSGNDINGGLGSKHCVTVDTSGRTDPRLWLIQRTQQSCFHAEHCVFRFSKK